MEDVGTDPVTDSQRHPLAPKQALGGETDGDNPIDVRPQITMMVRDDLGLVGHIGTADFVAFVFSCSEEFG